MSSTVPVSRKALSLRPPRDLVKSIRPRFPHADPPRADASRSIKPLRPAQAPPRRLGSDSFCPNLSEPAAVPVAYSARSSAGNEGRSENASIHLAIARLRYNWKNFLSRRRSPPLVTSVSRPSPFAGADASCTSVADRLATTVSLSDSASSGCSRSKMPIVSCAISSTSQSSVARTVALRGSPVNKDISPKHSPAIRVPTCWERPSLSTCTSALPVARMNIELPASPCEMILSPFPNRILLEPRARRSS